MADDNTNQKKRKPKWAISYSKMTIPEAEKRLGIWLDSLNRDAVSVESMLVQHKSLATVESGRDEIKKRVYDNIVEHLEIEGYPTEADPDFNEANINDLVYIIVHPILSDFMRKTGRNIRLRREKEIISVDSETGGKEEFVVIDRISVGKERVVLVIEAKRSSVGDAMKQCLLSMKDARDNNKAGEVYGFVTTGETWRMLSYDGASFRMTRKMHVLFEGMDRHKELWMKDYSALVDCMYAALSNGGIVQND
ncbi:hypothetical protein DFP73DRAFT_229896 [Morchella snyderi]|nr:hypothetical protein DFP73DRAFT_229896 [Morchella snyderi]